MFASSEDDLASILDIFTYIVVNVVYVYVPTQLYYMIGLPHIAYDYVPNMNKNFDIGT